MAIFAPGIRDRHHRSVGVKKRNVVGILSLTAMVDMFTVLTVFLLQNYNVTGQVINIPKEIQLPKASSIKELKPSHIVNITPEFITLDDVKIMPFPEAKNQKDWLLEPLRGAYEKILKADIEKKKKSLKSTLQDAVRNARSLTKPEDDLARVTLQADKAADFLSVKKVMYTLVQGGAAEINFAVLQKEKEKPQ